MKKISMLCVLMMLLAGCTPQSNAVATPTPEAIPLSPSPSLAPAIESPVPAEESARPVETILLTETPVPATSAPVSTQPLGWDGSLETLTLADFPTELAPAPAVSSAEKPLYLVAQLPDQGAWLYCWYGPQKTQGLILRVGDNWQYLDLSYLTYRSTPEIALGDFDGDLEMELALLLYTGAGTGVSVWDLHIVELGTEGAWTLHTFSSDDYTAILSSAVTTVYDPETNAITLRTDGAELTVPLEVTDIGDFAGIALGLSNADYTISGDGIRASFGGWLDASGVPATTTYVVTASADVIYTGSVFGLANLTLVPI